MSTTTNTSLPPNFDPFTQNFTLIGSNGQPFQASMVDVEFLRQYGVRTCINYGSQVGACIMLLLVLLMLTKREKRLSWIFGLNTLCLFLNIVRSILQCIWFTGNFFNVYSNLANDASHDRWQDKANTIASQTLTLLLVICVMASLSMQVWVVCITTPKFQRFVIMSSTTAIALIAIGLRFAVTVINNHQTMISSTMLQYQKLLTAMYITQAIAIWAFCFIFTFKLGYALIQRKRLGMTQFGPMQIIFIMGAQTMIIPAIFTCLQFYNDVPELATQALTIVCIFLPLSAIWAGVIANDTAVASSGPDSHQRLLNGQFGRTPAHSTAGSRTGDKSSRNGSTIASSMGKEPDSPGFFYKTKDSIDPVIQVDREWSVEKGRMGNAGDRV